MKSWPEFFEAVKCGVKAFDIRKDDRRFRVGDLLALRCWDPDAEEYTQDPHLDRRVSYVLKGGQFGLAEGYVCLGLERAPQFTPDKCRDFASACNVMAARSHRPEYWHDLAAEADEACARGDR